MITTITLGLGLALLWLYLSPSRDGEQQPEAKHPQRPATYTQLQRPRPQPQPQPPRRERPPSPRPQVLQTPPQPLPQPQPQVLPTRPRLRKGVDRNQDNKRNPHYVDLRNRARHAGDEMKRCARESQAAYQAGEHLRAAQLSEQKQAFCREMETLHLEASEWIYKENNLDNGPGEVDLHGQFVEESFLYVDRAIDSARARGEITVRFIVGQGTHSDDGVPKLRRAVQEYLQEKQIDVRRDPNNAGVLIVQL